ncbi:hypothetical protein ACFPK1_19735 [Actinomycetospora rhizophila]|uniref:Uncharacterized protein n=1 Tax=Actinomycetospora rhizophila TaxID=1416876 RepID=A0ABV9ZGF2_9PSEU
MEGSARQPAVHGLSASAILAVAEGLRWADPQLSVALAEHVARSAGDDADARGAAERSAVLALGQSDRAAALILRALPLLRDAEREARGADAAVLRCELALAAVRCEEVDGAEALLEPLAGGQVLSPTVRADALVAWAAARAARGDVPGVDAAARQVEDLVGTPTDDVRRLAVARSRAHARRVGGDATGALAVLRDAVTGEPGVDGGRETAMLVADQVELLAELGRADEARETAAPALAGTPQTTTALAVGRVRCTLAGLVAVPAGDLDTAAHLAREAEADLVARGHEAQAAEAIEVLAEVAARRGESRHALDELRRAHAHATAAREETTRARIALAVALARAEDAPPATGSGEQGPAEPTEAQPAPDADPLAAVRASLAALGTPGGDVGAGPSPADLLSAALAATELGSFEELTTRSAEPSAGTGGPPSEAPAPEEAPDPAPEPAPRRRRARYRDDEDPGAALAAALAAAREGGLEAFTATAAPSANGDSTRDGAVDAGHDDGRGDSAAEARSRRLARARARWETSESLLPRRPEPPDGRGEVPVDAEPQGPDQHLARGHADDGERHRRRRDPLEQPVGGGHGGLADDPAPRRNGHGAVGGGQVMRGAPAPGETVRVDGAPRAGGNGRPGSEGGAREDEPRTVAGRWGEALGTGTSSSAADDEYRRELALTLVDLLAEYEAAPEPAAPTTQVVGRPPATSAEPRPGAAPPAPGTRNGVPSARRADDSGPRLADLLADAMDAYHSVDPGAAVRRARR